MMTIAIMHRYLVNVTRAFRDIDISKRELPDDRLLPKEKVVSYRDKKKVPRCV